MKKHIWAVGLAIVVTGLLAACASPQQRAERQALRNVKEALANMKKMREALMVANVSLHKTGELEIVWKNPLPNWDDSTIITDLVYIDLVPVLGCVYEGEEDDAWCCLNNLKYNAFCKDSGCYVSALDKDHIYLSSYEGFFSKDGEISVGAWRNRCLPEISSKLGSKICESLEDYYN